MIGAVVLSARVVLTTVLIVAGVAKLRDPAGSRDALAGFRVPVGFISPLALALPLAECAIAIGLLAVPTVWPAAVGALALLGVFLGVVTLNVLGGRTPECHCFGQLHSEPVGPATLLRIGLLAAIAAFLAVTAWDVPGPSLLAPLAGMTGPEALTLIGFVSLLLLSGMQSVLIYQLMRQQGRLLLKLEDIAVPRQAAAEVPIVAKPAPKKQNTGLSIGAAAPAFRLNNLDDMPVASEALLAEGKPLLLIFTNPKCGPCAALVPEITHWALDPELPARIVIVSEGTVAENFGKFPQHGQAPVLLQAERETAQAYKAHGTPAAVIVRANGDVGSVLALGADDIRDLVHSLADPVVERDLAGNAEAEPQAPVRQLSAGESVSSLSLRDSQGRAVPLTSFAGTATLLLFWNAQCGFCQRMLNDLRLWAAAPPPDAPALVVVSMAAHDGLDGLQGVRVLTDPAAQVSAALGANGTPMAVLLGPDSRIAAPVAAGAHAVFALASGRVSEAA